MEIISKLQRPLVIATIAGAVFFSVVELILIVPSLVTGSGIKFLSPTDTISLLTGTVTAAGLSAVAAQVMESARNAEARTLELRRQSALQLDSLHAHFNSVEMRKHRNIAYLYLRFLMDSEGSMATYARYWIADMDITIARNDFILMAKAPVNDSSNPFAELVEVTFIDCDAAVSSIVAFYTRLSSHILQSFPDIDNADAKLDAATIEAFSPFFWTYWQNRLKALSDECQKVYQQEAQSKGLSAPFFRKPFERLDRHLGSKSSNPKNE
jgi:hypothetical protein